MRFVWIAALGAMLTACPGPPPLPKGPPPEYEIEDASAFVAPAARPASDGGP